MKRKRNSERHKLDCETGWEKAAAFYEGLESLPVLSASEPLPTIERRRLLGPGKKKLIALRLPQDDIESLKEIAKRHERKYQQLMVQAIEQFLDRYQQAAVRRKKAV